MQMEFGPEKIQDPAAKNHTGGLDTVFQNISDWFSPTAEYNEIRAENQTGNA